MSESPDHTIARIALIEDDPIVGESLQERLQLENYACDWFPTGREALNGIGQHPYQLILSDIRMPDMDGEQLFDALMQQRTELPPFIFITGYGSIEQAVRLLRKGATDYLTKPLDLPELLARLRDLVKHRPPPETDDDGIAPGMRPFFQKIPHLAPHPEVVVLIQGESGVGKEVLARHLHETLTPKQPFEALNCAALPESLAGSELFGHEKGAFTNASRQHAGAFERAGSGVLFLDEIGDMSLELQAQLLRAIQERVIQRIGGEKTIPFQARLICASHQNLQQLVREGRFREDLYYRLNVVQFEIPPLRKRPADILWLGQQFIRANAARIGREPPPAIDDRTRDAMLAYEWPGNVRELKNLIDRACIFCESDSLSPEMLGIAIASPTNNLRSARDEAERERILHALDVNQGHMQKTADMLGISRKTLWGKMKKLSIDKQSFTGSA